MTNALKGHAMNRGTLMVLKRLIVTALGALGLGALVAGPTSAQEIPAPDLFDGQVACSMNVPTPPTSLAAAVTTKVMSGMSINVGQDGDANFGTPQGDDANLANILYVIDPHFGNCGAGWVTDAEGMYLDAEGNVLGDQNDPALRVPVAIAAGVAADVGAGYSDTLAKFMAANMADENVKMAEAALKTLTDAQTAGAEDTPQITAARATLATAMTARDKAHTDLYATAAGPINMAGLAEWRAKGAVEMAISGWNTAVTMQEAAMTALGPTEYNNKYVEVTSTQLLALVDNDGNVNLVNVRQYANAEGDNTSTQDAMTGVITGDSAFDAAGNLLVPMRVNNGPDGTPDTADDFLEPTTAATSTYMAVNERLTMVNDVVKAVQTLADGNENALLQPVIDEALRRAKLEQAHYQMQYDTMIADNDDLRAQADLRLQYNDTDSSGTIEVDERTAANERTEESDFARTDFVSMKTNYDGLQAANTARDNAGVMLQTAVADRETKTTAVRTAFTTPQDFYQQLVDRRTTLKNRADAEVTRLAGLTGDDAPTAAMTTAAMKAATDAQTALTAAEDIQESFQDLLADDSPVKALVEETLKPDEGTDAVRGDDGGVLVDTLQNAFDAAENAKETADTASNAVAGLTAMDDPETEDVDETGAVTKPTRTPSPASTPASKG